MRVASGIHWLAERNGSDSFEAFSFTCARRPAPAECKGKGGSDAIKVRSWRSRAPKLTLPLIVSLIENGGKCEA